MHTYGRRGGYVERLLAPWLGNSHRRAGQMGYLGRNALPFVAKNPAARAWVWFFGTQSVQKRALMRTCREPADAQIRQLLGFNPFNQMQTEMRAHGRA